MEAPHIAPRPMSILRRDRMILLGGNELSRTGDLAYLAVMPDTFRLLSVNLAGVARALAATTDSRGRPTWASSVLDKTQFSWPRVSPDGRRIALELSEAPFSWDVWIYDIESRTLTPLTRISVASALPAGATAAEASCTCGSTVPT